MTEKGTEKFGPVGVPDAFQRLWTPYRMVYIDAGPTREQAPCPFCVAPSLTDEEALIVHRGVSSYVILNLYPYNSGHLLICPYRHVADYTDLTDEERTEVGLLTAAAMRVERAVSNPQGFNLGMNQGPVAGAGIAAHLHQHVVPRWGGDANFFPIIAQTKAIPQLLGDARSQLAEAWENHSGLSDERGQN
nr:HIT domain-containing protein [Actinomyces minihominis]